MKEKKLAKSTGDNYVAVLAGLLAYAREEARIRSDFDPVGEWREAGKHRKRGKSARGAPEEWSRAERHSEHAALAGAGAEFNARRLATPDLLDQLVVTSPAGEPVDPNNFRHRIWNKHVLKKAAAGSWTVKDLRDSYASHL